MNNINNQVRQNLYHIHDMARKSTDTKSDYYAKGNQIKKHTTITKLFAKIASIFVQNYQIKEQVKLRQAIRLTRDNFDGAIEEVVSGKKREYRVVIMDPQGKTYDYAKTIFEKKIKEFYDKEAIFYNDRTFYSTTEKEAQRYIENLGSMNLEFFTAPSNNEKKIETEKKEKQEVKEHDKAIQALQYRSTIIREMEEKKRLNVMPFSKDREELNSEKNPEDVFLKDQAQQPQQPQGWGTYLKNMVFGS